MEKNGSKEEEQWMKTNFFFLKQWIKNKDRIFFFFLQIGRNKICLKINFTIKKE